MKRNNTLRDGGVAGPIFEITCEHHRLVPGLSQPYFTCKLHINFNSMGEYILKKGVVPSAAIWTETLVPLSTARSICCWMCALISSPQHPTKW